MSSPRVDVPIQPDELSCCVPRVEVPIQPGESCFFRFLFVLLAMASQDRRLILFSAISMKFALSCAVRSKEKDMKFLFDQSLATINTSLSTRAPARSN